MSDDNVNRRPLYKPGQRVKIALSYGQYAGIEATVVSVEPMQAVSRSIITYLYNLRLDDLTVIELTEEQIKGGSRAVSTPYERWSLFQSWNGETLHTGITVAGQTTGRVMFTISDDGRMTLGEGVTPDEAATSAAEFVELVNAKLSERMQKLEGENAELRELARAVTRLESVPFSGDWEAYDDVQELITRARALLGME